VVVFSVDKIEFKRGRLLSGYWSDASVFLEHLRSRGGGRGSKYNSLDITFILRLDCGHLSGTVECTAKCLKHRTENPLITSHPLLLTPVG